MIFNHLHLLSSNKNFGMERDSSSLHSFGIKCRTGTLCHFELEDKKKCAQREMTRRMDLSLQQTDPCGYKVSIAFADPDSK